MEVEIINQEAYATRFTLSVDFIYKGKRYEATCDFTDSNGTDDIVVQEVNTGIEMFEGEIYDIAEGLLINLDIEKHITF